MNARIYLKYSASMFYSDPIPPITVLPTLTHPIFIMVHERFVNSNFTWWSKNWLYAPKRESLLKWERFSTYFPLQGCRKASKQALGMQDWNINCKRIWIISLPTEGECVSHDTNTAFCFLYSKHGTCSSVTFHIRDRQGTPVIIPVLHIGDWDIASGEGEAILWDWGWGDSWILDHSIFS